MNLKLLVLFLVFLILIELSIAANGFYYVNKPVINLRSEAIPMNFTYVDDPYQQTQLLFGEPVLYIEENEKDNDWVWVSSLRQYTYSQFSSFKPYTGLVKKDQITEYINQPTTYDLGDEEFGFIKNNTYNYVVSSRYTDVYSRPCHILGCTSENIMNSVSMGTYFTATDETNTTIDDGWVTVKINYFPSSNSDGNNNDLVYGYVLEEELTSYDHVMTLDPHQVRENIVRQARKSLGNYYFWGGRSIFNPYFYSNQEVLTGLDCSGLVSMSYLSNFIILPRNANDIYLISKNITKGPSDFKKADLFFFASTSQPDYVHHIMLYAGDNKIVESATNSTRVLSIEAKFNVPTINDLYWGQTFGTDVLYYGTLGHLMNEHN
eukprot:TRINITY_DN9125_c0_g1_i1.p1 TRINITY_DN9125_c0_g1~~TRINITY_DN9125_c0_g1_i1.p1  ORF type:complete len:377 (+),score=84.86 TRINITY_DN9125_c0_g1_i1:47-1177(+)